MAELTSGPDGWADLSAAIAGSDGRCVSLAVDDSSGDCLHRLQVTTTSALGAIGYYSGGLLIDEGWIRLFGAGHQPLPSIAAANATRLEDATAPEFLLVGVDVLGGKFAINGGGLDGDFGDVNLWAPDTLSWETLGVGYGGFVHSLIDGAGDSLYESLRWPGWEADVSRVGLGRALMLYPPPCTIEGRDTTNASKRAVPREEMDGWLRALAEAPDGPVRIKIDP